MPTPNYAVLPPFKIAFNIEELADAAGYTTRTIWADIMARRLPVVRLGPGRRPVRLILREDAIAWWQRRPRRGAHKAHELRIEP